MTRALRSYSRLPLTRFPIFYSIHHRDPTKEELTRFHSQLKLAQHALSYSILPTVWSEQLPPSEALAFRSLLYDLKDKDTNINTFTKGAATLISLLGQVRTKLSSILKENYYAK